MLAVEEAVRRAVVDHDLVLDTGCAERLVERPRVLDRDSGVVAALEGEDRRGRSRRLAESALVTRRSPRRACRRSRSRRRDRDPSCGGEPRVAAAEAEPDREDGVAPRGAKVLDARARRPPARRPASSAARAACTRSRRRASLPRPCARSSRTRPRRTRARRSAARAPRRSGRGRGRPGGSRRRRAQAPRALRGTPRSGCRPAPRGRGRRATPQRPRAAGSVARSRGRSTCLDPTRRRRDARGRRRSSTSRRTRGSSPRPGRSRTITPASASRSTIVADSSAGARQETSVARLSGTTTSSPASSSRARNRSATSAARSNAHGGIAAIAALQPCDGRARREVRIEPRRSLPRLERSVLLVAVLREVARAADAKRVGVGDDERAGPLRPTQPLLAGDRVEVEPGRVDGHRADRLRAVDEDRDTGRGAELVHGNHRARRPENV